MKLSSTTGFWVIGLYIAPIFLWMAFSYSFMNPQIHWWFLAGGLLMSLLGALALYLLTIEEEEETPIAPPAEEEETPEVSTESYLIKDLENECAFLKQKNLDLAHDFELYKQESNQVKNTLSTELEGKKQEASQLIAQKEEFDKKIREKEKKILSLDAEINDLQYEIKTLIDFNQNDVKNIQEELLREESLEEVPLEEKPLQNMRDEDAEQLLRQHIEEIEKIPTLPEWESPYLQYRKWHMHSLSALFPFLEKETSACLFAYSIPEQKALYANSEAYNLTGITSEEFIHRFHFFVPQQSVEWREAMSLLCQEKIAPLNLIITNPHKSLSLKSLLSAIPSGPFKGTILGIAYN